MHRRWVIDPLPDPTYSHKAAEDKEPVSTRFFSPEFPFTRSSHCL